MQELLEVKTGRHGVREKSQTKYFIAKPQSQRGGEPRVKIYDEDEVFIEEFTSWTHLQATFRWRGWEVTDHTVWSLEGTYIGYLLTNR